MPTKTIGVREGMIVVTRNVGDFERFVPVADY